MYDYIENLHPCVDWLRGIVTFTDVNDFFAQLGKIDRRLSSENFSLYGTGLLNYSKRFVHKEVPSLTFAFNPAEPSDEDCMIASNISYSVNKVNPFILISLSGDAIRFLGSDSLKSLIKFLHKNEFRCTRLDLAIDCYDKDNPIVPLMQEAFSNFICPSVGDVTLKTQMARTPKNYQHYVNVEPKTGVVSHNYVLGNHGSSHGMLRLYDKRFECLYGRNAKFGPELVGDREYWYRCELELHNGNHKDWAQEAFVRLATSDALYALFGKSLSDFFSIVQKKYSGVNHSDKDLVVIDWNAFIDQLVKTIHFVQLVKDKFVDTSFKKFEDYLWHNKRVFYIFQALDSLLPGLWRDLISSGRRRHVESKDVKYSFLDKLDDVQIPEGATSDEVRYLLYNTLSAS